MMSTPPSQEIMVSLMISYAMEIGSKQKYIAASVNPNELRSEVIKKALNADITE